CAREGSGFAYW
nr:immunoglobulin heavy chain junction region [Mus musculus]